MTIKVRIMVTFIREGGDFKCQGAARSLLECWQNFISWPGGRLHEGLLYGNLLITAIMFYAFAESMLYFIMKMLKRQRGIMGVQ